MLTIQIKQLKTEVISRKERHKGEFPLMNAKMEART